MGNLLHIAMAEIGVKEVTGPEANPRILQYAKDCGIHYKSDETPWCSVFMNWVAFKSGLERTNKGTARSWLNVGIPVSDPEPGDVVVFWRGSRDSWQGHVGIYTGSSTNNSRIYCLGGNQGNQVSITAKTQDRILGYRRLRPVGKMDWAKKNLKKGDTGPEVRQLQDALKQLGYNCGTSDGIFGPKTEQCLKDFQSSESSVKISGVFDKATRDFMQQTLENSNNLNT